MSPGPGSHSASGAARPSNDAPLLSLVIPVYNEERRLASTLTTVLAYLETRPYRSELLVVNDGSVDATERVAREAVAQAANGDQLCARVYGYRHNAGKGKAVRTGVLATRGHYVAFTDADLSTPLEEIDRALHYLRGPDRLHIVIGSRSAAGSEIRRAQPFYRRLSAKFFNVLRDLIVGMRGIRDSQCGLKVFQGDVARSVFARQRIDGFMFDVETVFIAQRLGLAVLEMGVPWTDMPDSKVRISSGLRLLPDLLRIRRLHGRLSPSDREDGN